MAHIGVASVSKPDAGFESERSVGLLGKSDSQRTTGIRDEKFGNPFWFPRYGVGAASSRVFRSHCGLRAFLFQCNGRCRPWLQFPKQQLHGIHYGCPYNSGHLQRDWLDSELWDDALDVRHDWRQGRYCLNAHCAEYRRLFLVLNCAEQRICFESRGNRCVDFQLWP